MEEELCAIKDDQTWTLTDLPTGWCAIGLKCVLKVKRDEHGVVVRHKARLVVKGYAQRQGNGYEEVFAPVARIEAVQLLLAMAAREGVASPPHGRQDSVQMVSYRRKSLLINHPVSFRKVMSIRYSDYTKLFMVYIRPLERGIKN
jgi:hypothetical protein